MHEYNKIEGVKPGFDEVVRFHPSQVVPGFQFVESGLHCGAGLEGASVLLARKLGENRELSFDPHVLGPMAHDLARTGSRYRARCYEGNRSEEHTSELQSLRHLVCRLLLEKK